MKARSRIAAMADLLSEGLEPHEVTVRMVVDREVRALVARAVNFELAAMNIDQPNGDRYGFQPNGSPRYAPEWYVAQGIKTGINEGLYGVLADVLSCEETDSDGRPCIGSILHDSWHWDGNGNNWSDGAV